MKDFDISDLKHLPLCPDLTFFKKTESEAQIHAEQSFYKNFINEFDDEDKVEENYLDDIRSQTSMLDDAYNMADGVDDLSSQVGDIGKDSPHFSDVNLGYDMKSTFMGQTLLDNFSYLRSDEIKEYIHQFGDGNKDSFKNLPNYTSFTKAFGQLNSIKLPAQGKDRKKKEEKLFLFSKDNEVSRNEVFDKEKPEKTKKDKVDIKKEMKKRKKVRQHYKYDKSL